jgi:uncharacterized protein
MVYMDQRSIYRNRISQSSLLAARVVVKETDLLIHASCEIKAMATELVLKYRGFIESFAEDHPRFVKTLEPWDEHGFYPGIIQTMIDAGNAAGVGPMAAVAGAIAESVGLDLLDIADEIIIENGGDIFIKTKQPVTVAIFAGDSSLSMKLGLKIDSGKMAKGVCTSSGTFGHSKSFGKADGVVVISDSSAMADAAATSIGNRVQSAKDIRKAIDFAIKIPGVKGVVIIIDDAVGAWGDARIVPLMEKKVEF